MHTTNYVNTFIEVADDCPVVAAEEPPLKGTGKTVAAAQYERLAAHPYELTSDDLLFDVHAERAGIPPEERAAEQERFFSKGQPCLRSSPLSKRYGWGTHHDEEGRVALYPVGSDEYERLRTDTTIEHTKAMRSKRA